MMFAGTPATKMRIRYSEGLIKDGMAVAGETEQGVFEALGLPCPLPSEREIVDSKPVLDANPKTVASPLVSAKLGRRFKIPKSFLGDC